MLLLLLVMMATFSAGWDASDCLGCDGFVVGLAAGSLQSSDSHPYPRVSFWLFVKPIAVELFIMSDDDDDDDGGGGERRRENS